MAVTEELQLLMKKQQYGMVGNHTRVKVCHWTKSSIKDEGGCYKYKFYGINSHQCLQMTPSFTCNFSCSFCWRDHAYHTAPAMKEGIDAPEDIVQGSIEAQKAQLIGFKGNDKANQKKVEESFVPKHVALSLDGEPTLYPHIAGLVSEYKKNGMTTFLVTNGSMPDRVRELLKDPPTQLYVSLDAPTKELFEEIDKPGISDAWERLMETLDLLASARTNVRTVLRLTLIKGMNMCHPEKWAELFKRANPQFIEAKGFMWVGNARERLEKRHMPLMEEIREFSEELAKHSGYKVVDEHLPSRVTLLMNGDIKEKLIDLKTAF